MAAMIAAGALAALAAWAMVAARRRQESAQAARLAARVDRLAQDWAAVGHDLRRARRDLDAILARADARRAAEAAAHAARLADLRDARAATLARLAAMKGGRS